MRETLGILLLLFQAVLILPLAIELLRTRSGKGVSLLGEMLWVIAGIGWITYGVLSNSVVLMISGSLAFLGSLIVSVLIWNKKPLREKKVSVISAFLTGIVFALSIVFGGLIGISLSLSIFGVVQFIPQAITSWNSLRNGGAEGVPLLGSISRSLYTLTWAFYAGAWFVWGISVEKIDFPLLTWGLAGCIVFGMQFWSGIMFRTKNSNNLELAV